MTGNKEEALTEMPLEATKRIEERGRILAVVTQTLPWVNQTGRIVANDIWKIPSNLVKQLSENQIIVASEENYQKIFPPGEIFSSDDVSPRKEKSVLGSYDIDTGRLGINLDTFSKATSFMREHIYDLGLETKIDAESFIVFSVLSHEGIIHGWTVKKEITEEKLQYLLREYGKKLIAPEIPEEILDSDWDRMSITTEGCSVIYRKPGEANIIMIGREINDAYALLLTQDLMLPFLMVRYGLDENTSSKILAPLALYSTRMDYFAEISWFHKKIGSSQFANLYFTGDFYSDLSSRLGAKEMVDLFVRLHRGEIQGFFNEYLKNYGKD